MKAKQFLRFAMVLFAILASSLPAWADDPTVTIAVASDTWTSTGYSGGNTNYPTSVTKSGITVSSTKGYKDGTTAIREYSGCEITISSSVGNMTQIVFTSTANKGSNYGPDKIAVKSGSSGTYSTSNNSKLGTWTYATGTSSVTFSASAQFRWTQVVITYVASASCETEPTFGTLTATAGDAQVEVSSKITALGDCDISDYGFVYGTSSNPTGNKTSKGNSYSTANTTFSNTFTSLTNGTTYHFRAYAVMGGTTYYGDDVSATPTLPNYTVTFNAGTGTCGTPSFTQTSSIRSTTLPTATPPATCTGWSFAGWCTSSAGSADDNTTSPGTILTGSYTPTGNVTLYAVYTRSGGGSSTTTKNFTITFDDNGTDSSTELTTSTFTNEVTGCSDSISSVSSTSKCYAGNGGLKMSSAKYNGSFALTLAHSLKITQVDLNVKKKSTATGGAMTVTIGSTSFSTEDDYSTSFVDMEFTGTATTSNSVSISSTSTTSSGTSADNRVAWLTSIKIYHEVIASTTYYMTSLVCCQNLGTINGSVICAISLV